MFDIWPSQFKGQQGFTVSMDEIRQHTDRLSGTVVKAVASVTTWHNIETNVGMSYVPLISHKNINQE